MLLPENHINHRRLETLVENQTTYGLQNAELHIFETHQQAEKVLLSFNNPVLATMIKGKKVMHLNDMTAFDFLPGESLILPPDELMCIDFPEAQLDNPTQCLAMAIGQEKIIKTVNYLNEFRPKIDDEWKITDYNFHFTNDIAITQLIQRLIFVFTENHPSKDLFANNMLDELIIRILQTESSKIYTEQAMQLSSSHRLAYVIQYIRQNLSNDFTIQELSNKSYMSESNFHRVFKNELNMTPIEFVINERIKLAKSLLRNPKKKIKEVFTECGFNSVSYFIRQFIQKEKMSPKEYQIRAKSTLMA